MKILLINKYFYRRAGAETVFFQERDFLLGQGHEVCDFSMHHPHNFVSPCSDFFVSHIEYQGPKSFRDVLAYPSVASKFIRNGEAVRNLRKLLAVYRPSVAHLHNVYHQLTPAIISVLKDHGVKVVLTLHDYKVVCPNYKMLRHGAICSACHGGNYWNCFVNRCEDGSLPKSFLLTLEALWHRRVGSYEGVDLFISPSKFLAALVGRGGIAEDRIRVLPNGVDHHAVTVTKRDDNYILYLGRISKEKGIPTLLKAHVRAKMPLSLKVVGTGPLLEELAQEYKDVDFLGFKTGNELNSLIGGASFVVVPSEWYENCSMSVLEAMAYGKPVIGAKIGGIPEQIEHGKSGFLFEMGNEEELAAQITILAADEGLRKKMGDRARQKLIEEYSLDRHCKGLLSLYDEMLSV